MSVPGRIMIMTKALVAAATLLAATSASAQLPSASVRSLGMSGTDTAVALGVGAISANPAGLAMPDSGFSLAVIPVGVSADLGRIRLERLQALVGNSADSVEKLAELADELSESGARVRLRADATALALTFGNLVEQISVGLQAAAVGSIALDVAATDTVRVDGDGYVATTYGLSLARPLPVLMEHLDTVAIGATAKYGAVHIAGAANGSAGTSAEGGDRSFDRIRLDAIWSGTDDLVGIVGSGFGLDVGVMARRDPWAFGASVQNLPATFVWDEDNFSYFRVSLDDRDADLGERPFDDAPAELRTKLPHPFAPSARIGAAYRALDNLTVSGDVHYRFGGQPLAAGPRWHAGVGAEYRPVDVVELRAGVSFVTDAVQFGGGASLMLGPYSLSVAIAATTTGGLGARIGLLSFGTP